MIESIRCELMRKTYLKFLILKVRAKLSFTAYLKNYTISELFVRQISNSHAELVKSGQIKSKVSSERVEDYFEEIILS